ncbi:CHAP domain-containing protein [Pseudooceanicola sp. CBS1P-1]|uniref:CHAP domain-containing protein n=2 Tax=Paracoccaceae TaxID=31989 RepID=A0A6L7G7Y4_9RHOB|nr:CHAP domain-containing protein [Pseudooceanicola endophyticus]MXN20181.1 CHAP domain-containing protein [Pseudooceanicola albus]
MLLLTAACTTPHNTTQDIPSIDQDRKALAFAEVKDLQTRGQRVWCVPFARNISGIDIYGDARTWWNQAKAALFPQDNKPQIGAVMTFKPTKRMPLGHVAVVSKVVSDREILVDHANWHKNRISMNMRVVDVSKKNDWSAVRLESNPGTLGSVYPVEGFILPQQADS